MTETNILKKDIQKAIKEFKKDNCPNLNLPKHKLMKIADDNNISIKPTGKIKQDPYKVFPPSPLKGTKKKTTKPKSRLSEIEEATRQIKEATNQKLKDMKEKKEQRAGMERANRRQDAQQGAMRAKRRQEAQQKNKKKIK